MKYLQNKGGWVVEVLSETPDKVTFTSQGGGFQGSADPAEFHAEFNREWVAGWHRCCPWA